MKNGISYTIQLHRNEPDGQVDLHSVSLGSPHNRLGHDYNSLTYYFFYVWTDLPLPLANLLLFLKVITLLDMAIVAVTQQFLVIRTPFVGGKV